MNENYVNLKYESIVCDLKELKSKNLASLLERPNTRYNLRPRSGYFRVQLLRVRVRIRVQKIST